MTTTRTTSDSSTAALGRILVTGAGGKTGRRVAQRLWDDGRRIRAASRSTTPRFDWDDPATWPAALEGTDAAYIAYQPDLAAPGATGAIAGFVAAARAAGLRRLVLLSGRGEPEAQRCEEIVRASGLEWTILRASWFSQNFDEGHLLGPVLDGTVALPVPDVPEPFVDADDVAEIAAAALTGEGHVGRLYELTGPRSLTFTEATAVIAAAAGRPVRYQPMDPADYADALVAHGVPAGEAAMLTELFSTVLDGRNAATADGVRRALGRPARDFADYARAAAATGVWSMP